MLTHSDAAALVSSLPILSGDNNWVRFTFNNQGRSFLRCDFVREEQDAHEELMEIDPGVALRLSCGRRVISIDGTAVKVRFSWKGTTKTDDRAYTMIGRFNGRVVLEETMEG